MEFLEQEVKRLRLLMERQRESRDAIVALRLRAMIRKESGTTR